MANVLTPEYLDIDYNTIMSSIKDGLADSEIFKDYNYEGSNISLLIELVSYIGELNTYFLNKVAKNVFMETTDVYENANRLSRQEGYEPKGYISSKTTLSLEVSASDGTDEGLNYVEGDVLYIPAWHKLTSSKQYDGENIVFATTKSQTAIADSHPVVNFDVPVVQGEVIELSYTGNDMVDNTITLPTYHYAFDDDLDDEVKSIELTVNGIPWTRIGDWYDEIGALTDVDDVYMLQYDKYERCIIVFSSSRSVPEASDDIIITTLKSIGVHGNVAKSTITSPDDEFIKNTTNASVGPEVDGWLDNNTLSIANSAASIGGALPEDIDEIRENANAIHNAQYRNVTSTDYKANLESRSDVECAHAWGEQEIAPSGSILQYNKVHISVIPPGLPPTWQTGTINTSANTWTPSGGIVSGAITVPTEYVPTYTSDLEEFLEPRKMLNAYETWELPELVYFSFMFGVRLYRLYTFADVSTDIQNKLIYYFRSANRDFHDLIDFKDIMEYLLDTTIISPSNDFDYIKGIRNLVLRDIDVNKEIHEINIVGNYPQYTTTSYHSDSENRLRPIRLGFSQFPILHTETVSVVEET
jgi:hypothetical protein